MALPVAHRSPTIISSDTRGLISDMRVTSYYAPPLIGAPSPSSTRLSLISSLLPSYKCIPHLHTANPRSKYAKSVPRAAATTFSRSSAGATASSVKVGSCFVFRPSPTAAVRGVINFLGGAFVGATPDIAYRTFIDMLTSGGYVVIATPYNITFDHANCQSLIHLRFNDCLQTLYKEGLPRGSPAGPLSGSEIQKLPIFGVGHSNGALMHLLIGSLCTTGKLPAANVLISFNNKPAAGAVPFFDQVGPSLKQASSLVEASPLTGLLGIASSLAEQALETLDRNRDVLPKPFENAQLEEVLAEQLATVSRFGSQIAPVFAEVQDGVSEFSPTPLENRAITSRSYSIPRTLLLKFEDDSIDETRELESLLRVKIGMEGSTSAMRVDFAELRGTHATPLAQDIPWVVGEVYTPIDALRQVATNVALADLKKLGSKVVYWLNNSEL